MIATQRRLRSGLMVAAVVLAVLVGLLGTGAPAGASTTLAPINGQGSTYAALAFQTWTQHAQDLGLNVNYTATGSPAGLSAYGAGTATFAGTEGEYSELYGGTPDPTQHVPRGYAYTPDVAGAVALMYHVQTPGGTTVNWLHLSPLTIARIFMGYIKYWTSSTISETNKGLVLPHEPITLDIRSGQSGTTALFYDFVKHEDPTQFTQWADQQCFSTSHRIWEVDSGCEGFGQGAGFDDLSGSDQQAEAIATKSGLWSIGYDEFGYAIVYHDNVAWVENASGTYTLPYAKNITAALKYAVLAKTTSQTLAGVYTSTTPTVYPASYYSYILYQCATTPTRSTCKGPYPSQGVMNTMAKFMRYIACTGQVTMAQIGYAPLPTFLSQFMANAIGYMEGTAPTTLTVTNCANPQFKTGTLGIGSKPPPDPTKTVTKEGTGPGGPGSGTTTTTSNDGGPGSGTTTTTSSAGGPGSGTTTTTSSAGGPGSGTTTTDAAGQAGAVGLTGSGTESVGGGTSWITPDPTAYRGPLAAETATPWPWLLLVLLLVVPVAWLTVGVRRRRRTAVEEPGQPPPSTESG